MNYMITKRPRSIVYHLGLVVVFFLLSSFLFACAPSTQPTSQQVVTVFATSSAQPWMDELFACANDLSITVNVAAEEPEIYLRIGEPENLISPAYQIGEEELLVVTHRESPVQNISLPEAQALFAGEGGESVQVWVYPSALDVAGVFEQVVMQGRGVASSARVAVDPAQMSDVLNAESNALGILPRRWKAGNVREVLSLGRFPVLAVTAGETSNTSRLLLDCLQSN